MPDTMRQLVELLFCCFSSHELERGLEFGDYSKVVANVQS